MPQVDLDEMVEAVCADRLISFPTDTVPALAACPTAAEQIFVAKRRSPEKPLILMAANIDEIWDYVVGSEAERTVWQQAMNRYWPGAVTLVLPASDRVPAVMNPKDPSTIGVRIPDHAIARAILQRTKPLATTSANRSGEPALLHMSDIEAAFPEVLTLSSEAIAKLSSADNLEAILLGSGMPSTVIRWMGDRWQVLRQGAVVVEE